MLCITFDNFGCAADWGFGQGRFPPCAFPDQVPAVEWDNYNEIGLTLGHPRILLLLEQLKIPTTFFAEGFAAKLHGAEMKRWTESGHEIALHGWKHEMWANLTDAAHEERLVRESVEAVTALTGQAPVGFRPPGLKISPNTDDILERYGIRYISQVSQRDPGHAARLEDLGATYARTGEEIVSRLPLLPCSDDLTDANTIAPAYGGVAGADDCDTAYNRMFDLACAHERTTPETPWVFIAHPFTSGNRAWFAFERFLRRLHAEFGSAAFRTGRDVMLRAN